ncbi:MAG: hypothetical protein LBC38_03265, partial [Oscillospiraceae bacterium]|nr:hypothetical protein [Oscillospiraceae bacterium]
MDGKKMKSLPTRLLINRAKSWYLLMFVAILGSFGLGMLGGLEYAGYNALEKNQIASDTQISEGTYGYISTRDVLGTFAFNGYDSVADENGEPLDYKYRYVAAQIGEKLFTVRIPKSQNTLLDSPDNEIYGTFLPVDEEILPMLRSSWAAELLGAEEIEKYTPELMLTVGYVGYQPEWLGKLLFYVFSGLALIAMFLVLRCFALNFKIYDYADYPDGKDFGKNLHITPRHVWIFMPFQEICVKREIIEDVIP